MICNVTDTAAQSPVRALPPIEASAAELAVALLIDGALAEPDVPAAGAGPPAGASWISRVATSVSASRNPLIPAVTEALSSPRVPVLLAVWRRLMVSLINPAVAKSLLAKTRTVSVPSGGL